MSYAAIVRSALLAGLSFGLGYAFGHRLREPADQRVEVSGNRLPGSEGDFADNVSQPKSRAGADATSEYDLERVPTSVLEAETLRRSRKNWNKIDERFPYPRTQEEEKAHADWVTRRLGQTYAEQEFWKLSVDVKTAGFDETIELYLGRVSADEGPQTTFGIQLLSRDSGDGISGVYPDPMNLKKSDGLVYAKFDPGTHLRTRFPDAIVTPPQPGLSEAFLELFDGDEGKWVKIDSNARWLPATFQEFQAWKKRKEGFGR